MSVIEAASAGVKDMADGSLRITFEFEPRFAAEAFALFGPRGRAVAVAAFMDGAKAVKAEAGNPASEPSKEPIGPLCKWLVMRCAEPEFWDFLTSEFPNGPAIHSETDAAEFVKELLGVASRKDVDNNVGAQSLFHSDIRYPYKEWIARRGG